MWLNRIRWCSTNNTDLGSKIVDNETKLSLGYILKVLIPLLQAFYPLKAGCNDKAEAIFALVVYGYLWPIKTSHNIYSIELHVISCLQTRLPTTLDNFPCRNQDNPNNCDIGTLSGRTAARLQVHCSKSIQKWRQHRWIAVRKA